MKRVLRVALALSLLSFAAFAQQPGYAPGTTVYKLTSFSIEIDKHLVLFTIQPGVIESDGATVKPVGPASSYSLNPDTGELNNGSAVQTLPQGEAQTFHSVIDRLISYTLTKHANFTPDVKPAKNDKIAAK